MNNNCPFCNVPEDKIIASNQFCVAFYDGYPVSQGHTLIIPKRHVSSFFELTTEEVSAMYALLLEMKLKLDNKYSPDGYNIGVNVNAAAGQSIFHVHMHLIPRYTGDIPNPKGGVRGVIPNKMGY